MIYKPNIILGHNEKNYCDIVYVKISDVDIKMNVCTVQLRKTKWKSSLYDMTVGGNIFELCVNIWNELGCMYKNVL